MFRALGISLLITLGLVIGLCSANIKPAKNFNALDDAKRLRSAVEWAGTDEDTIINILTRRSLSQRLEIVKAYAREFDRSLDADLEDDISGDFYSLMHALITPLPEYYARLLNSAEEQSEIIPDVLLSLNAKSIKEVIHAYNSLKLDQSTSITNKLTRLRQPLTHNMIRMALDGARNKAKAECNTKRATEDAKTFLKGVPKQIEKVFATRSFKQLACTFGVYETKTKTKIDDAFYDFEFHDDLESSLKNIIEYVRSAPNYFAKRLHESMFRSGTNNDMLIRILVTRSEKDLDKIKKKFEEIFGQSLSSFIYDETSSDFRTALMNIVEA